MKKSILSTLLLVPALVACGGQTIISTQDSFSNPVLVNCSTEKMSWPESEYEQLTKFKTPKNMSKAYSKSLEEEGNPFAAALGSQMILTEAKRLIKTSCDPDSKVTEPDEKGVRTLKPKEPTSVPFGKKAIYRDGITIALKDYNVYEWIKPSNMFADKVVAPEGQILLVVDFNVGNDGTSPSTLSGRDLQVMDSQGRRFDPEEYNTGFMMWVNESRSNDLGEYDSVNPGSNNNKVLLFIIPENSENVTIVDRNEFKFHLNN
jgi:hypothetical protein